jgi:glycosyltransferase involved in cell wall biosynthesis
MSEPTISLCLIVRDEARDLPACLASVNALCDELVVVDTGSRDETVRLATEAGARVVHFAWCDDFAAARNASIAAARGRWVLVLDADERLTADSHARIRAALADPTGFVCGMLRLHDASRLDAPLAEVVSGKERIGDPMYVPRLLRRTEDLGYEGIVHESIRPWLLRHDNRVRDVGGDIVHFGAVPKQRSARDKANRNTRLLEKRLALEPDDFTIHGYLAHEYIGAGDEERAWEVIEQGWKLLRVASPTTLRSALRLAAARALLQFQRGDGAGALETARTVAAYEGEGPDTLFFRGRAHEMRAHHERDWRARRAELALAEQAYRACLGLRQAVFAQRYVRGASSWAGSIRLGTVRLLRGDPTEALALFESAHADKREVSEALWGRAEALVELGRAAEALGLLEPQLEDGDLARQADGWLVAAQAADALGQLDGLRRFLAAARERAGTGYVAQHRNLVHGTLHCQLLCYLGKPSPGRGVVGAAAALMAAEPAPDAGEPIDAPTRRPLATFVRNLLLFGHAALVERLLAEAAEQVLPGVTALVDQVVSGLGAGAAEQP